MMHRPLRLPFLISCAALCAGHAAQAGESPTPFAEAVFTEVVNEVQVVSPESRKAVKAAANDRLLAPDLVRTGRKSRAQLTAPDGTITRVGSSSVFHFDKSSRTINLESGSVLFHSPTGKGGGTIVTNSATASVVGTTIIVAATADGGFKLLILEGVATVGFSDGRTLTLTAGQMTFVRPSSEEGGGEPGPVLNFDLGALRSESGLIGGFRSELPSRDKIRQAARVQRQQVEDGDLVPTGLAIVGAAGETDFLVVDSSVIRQAADQFATASNLVSGPTSPAVPDPLSTAAGLSLVQPGTTPVPGSFIFRTPVVIPVDLAPASLSASAPLSVRGVLAGNLTVTGGVFDLSYLSGDPSGRTDVIGLNAISFGSMDFRTGAGITALRVAGDSLNIASGSTVVTTLDASTATTAPTEASFVGFSGVSLTDVSLSNPSGSLLLEATTGGLSMTGGAVAAGGSTPPLAGEALLQAPSGAVTLSGVTITAPGNITVDGSQSVTVTASTLDGAHLELNSGGAVTVASTTLNGSSLNSVVMTGAAVSLSTGTTVTTPGRASFTASAGDVELRNSFITSGSGFAGATGTVTLVGEGGSYDRPTQTILALGGEWDAGAGVLSLVGPAGVTVSGAVSVSAGSVSVNAASGFVTLSETVMESTAGALEWTAATAITADAVNLSAAQDLSLTAGGALTLSDSALAAGGVALLRGSALNARGVTLNAAQISMQAVDSLVWTGGSLTAAGSISLGGAPLVQTIALDGVTVSAAEVHLSAGRVDLTNVIFPQANPVTIVVDTGLSVNTATGATAQAGSFNASGVMINGTDIFAVGTDNLLWVPEQNIGDVTAPLHVLKPGVADFRGSKVDYAKTHDLDSFAVTRFPLELPNSHKMLPGVTLTAADFGLAADPVLPDGSPASLAVSGLLARNIVFSGATTLNLGPVGAYSADVAPLARADVVATGEFALSGSLTLTGLELLNTLEIRAARFAFGPASSVVWDPAYNPDAPGSLTLVSFSGITADGLTLDHRSGDLKVYATGGDILLSGAGTLVSAGTHIQVFDTGGALVSTDLRPGSLVLGAASPGANLALTGGSYRAHAFDGFEGIRLEAATVRLSSVELRSALRAELPTVNHDRDGDVPVAAGEYAASGEIRIVGSTAVRIDGGRLVASDIFIASVIGSPTIPPLDRIDIDGVNFVMSPTAGNVGLLMEANTINLQNLTFPDRVQVRLNSRDGVLNVGSSVLGAVNFVNNVNVRDAGAAGGVVSLMTADGINSHVWVQGGAITLQGAPLSGAAGTATSAEAPVHIQAVGASNAAGKFN